MAKKDCFYECTPKNMKLTKHMYADICHNLNNDFAIILGMLKCMQEKMSKCEETNIAVARLERAINYVQELGYYTEDE